MVRRRFAGAAFALAALVGLAAPSAASADVINYACQQPGCTVTVVTALVTGGYVSAAAGSVPGNTSAGAGAAALEDYEGLVGPAFTGAFASLGKVTTADQRTTTFIGSAGGAGEGANATAKSGSTSAAAGYYQYNLGNGNDVGAALNYANHTTADAAAACAVEIFAAFCVGTDGSIGPAGTTAHVGAGTFTSVAEENVIITVDSGPGRPTTVTSNVPLLP